MSPARYALRTAAFGGLHLLAVLAGHATAQTGGGVHVLWPAAVTGALWLVAQGRYGRRNLDVIALSVLAVLTPGGDPGLLGAFVDAVPQVVPALLFAWLLDRRLPGWWLGHGDRFRRPGPTLLRLAALAAVAALTAAALHWVIDTALTPAEAGYLLLRDTTAVFLGVLACRTARRRVTRRPGRPRPGLTLVR